MIIQVSSTQGHNLNPNTNRRVPWHKKFRRQLYLQNYRILQGDDDDGE